MRCKFCGSPSLHADRQHKTFSAGKAVAGAVTFGAVGAAAGFIGKDKNGYRCGACGSFMDAPMDSFTEMQLDGAIRDVEAGRGRSMYDYYKRQYPNIQANIPAEIPSAPLAQAELPAAIAAIPPEANTDTIKRSYRPARWQSGCPIWIEDVIIKTKDDEDRLALVAWNQSEKTIRSAYFLVKVFDDTGDEVASCRCVYQGLSVPPMDGNESRLPLKKDFSLGTDLAYRVELTCEKVAFDGDEVWRAENAGEEHALCEQVFLTKENFPRVQYVMSRYAEMRKTQARQDSLPYVPEFYMPEELDSLWLCDCGHPAEKGGRCPYCGDSLDEVREAFGQQRLREIQLAAVKDRAARRAKATQGLYDAAFAKREQEETSRKNRLYAEAEGLLKKNTIESVLSAAGKYQVLGDWKDAKEKDEFCKRRVEELRAKKAAKEERERQERERRAEEARIAAEAKAKKTKTALIIVAAVLALCIAGALVLTKVILPGKKYDEAVSLMEAGQYEEAISAFKALNGYKNSEAQIAAAENAIATEEAARIEAENAAAYEAAEALLESGDYEGALAAFRRLKDYRDSKQRALEAQNEILALEEKAAAEAYALAEELFQEGSLLEAAVLFYDSGTAEGQQRCLEIWRELTPGEATLSGGFAYTVGLRANGTVVASGKNYDGQCDVSGWKNIVAVSAGVRHTVGLRSDGTVVAAGDNKYGQCDVSDWADIVAIVAGDSHTVGLRSDGTVVAVGANNKGQCNVSNWKNIVAVSAGFNHTVGLRADGYVVATGDNGKGQCNVGWSDIVAITAGQGYTAGLRYDGTIVGTSSFFSGQREGWSNIIAISGGQAHIVALRSDGTVVAAGDNKYGQCDVSDWADIVAISAGGFHTVGLRADGSVVAVGRNEENQCTGSKWKNVMLP